MSDHIDPGINGLSNYRRVGSGACATVYAAWEEAAGRHVAVKVLNAVDDRGRRHFDRERLTIGQTTEHPNIVTMLRSGYTQPAAVRIWLWSTWSRARFRIGWTAPAQSRFRRRWGLCPTWPRLPDSATPDTSFTTTSSPEAVLAVVELGDGRVASGGAVLDLVALTDGRLASAGSEGSVQLWWP